MNRHQLASAIFDWIEARHNPRRRHSLPLSRFDVLAATRAIPAASALEVRAHDYDAGGKPACRVG